MNHFTSPNQELLQELFEFEDTTNPLLPTEHEFPHARLPANTRRGLPTSTGAAAQTFTGIVTDTDTDTDTHIYSIITPDEIGTLVAQQLASLSMKDREEVYHDVHGVAEAMVETPVLIRTKLKEMQDHLDTHLDATAYQLAAVMSPRYVHNPAFRLRFLRSDLFDAKLAALRFTSHFQIKLELFGKDLLDRDIVQDDLDPGALHSLYCGFSQQLPLRDRAGRCVNIQYIPPPEVSVLDNMRHDFYQSMTQSEDREYQTKGVVGVSLLMAQPRRLQALASDSWKVSRVTAAAPVRMVALHICYDNPLLWGPVLAMAKLLLGFFIQVRIREHFCKTLSDCMFPLQTYGVPTNDACFPRISSVDESIIDTDFHVDLWTKRRNLERLWAQKRQECQKMQANVSHGPPEDEEDDELALAREQEPYSGNGITAMHVGRRPYSTVVSSVSSSSSIPTAPETAARDGSTTTTAEAEAATVIDIDDIDPTQTITMNPGRHDVLLGRGKRYYEHHGNVRFRYWVTNRVDDYASTASTTEKKRMTYEVLRMVRQAGGQFLKEDPNLGWRVVETETARLKVSHVFRHMKERQQQQQHDLRAGGGDLRSKRDREEY